MWRILLSLCCLALPAHALDLPAAATPVVQPAATLPTEASALTDPAWRLVHDAMGNLAHGDPSRAIGYLDELRHRFPQHPAVGVSGPAFLTLDASRRVPTTIESPFAPETASKGARAELVTVQSMAGLALGTMTCVTAECDGARPFVLMNAAAVAVELGGSLYFTQQGIRPGEATAVNTGTFWGLLHGSLLQAFVEGVQFDANGNVIDNGGLSRDQKQALTVLGSQVAGTAAGVAVASLVHPRAGSVGLVNSGGLWAMAGTMLFLEASNWQMRSKIENLALLGAADVGMLAASYAASKVDVSRSRMLIIDAAGVAGGLLGAGVYVLAKSAPRDQTLAGAGLAGVVTGLAVGVVATRHWDVPELPVAGQPTLTPVAGGAVLGWAMPLQ